MEILHFENINHLSIKASVTIGQFDGLHIGHMALIKECLNTTYKKILITFNPLIESIILNKKAYSLLSQKSFTKKLEELGFDYLIIIDFNKDFQSKNKIEFIEELKQKFNIQKLVVGFDFHFGLNGEGNVNDLKQHFNTIIIDELKINDLKIGTKQIKQYLNSGEIEKANKMLGYNFYLEYNNNSFNEAINLLKPIDYDCLINGQKVIFNPTNEIKLPNNTLITFIK